MVEMRRGELWWASLPDPVGSGPGFRRPLLVVQSNDFNQSAIRTVICAVVSSNLRLEQAPGNVRIRARSSGLARDSVVNVSQLITIDKRLLTERISRLAPELLRDVDSGVRLVLAL
jgi:mRNA interferase MazF